MFLSPADRLSFLDRLAAVVRGAEWTLLDHCLMSNHVHLVIRLGQRGMGAGMRELIGGHAHWFNAAHERQGHVFGNRYHASPIRSDGHLEATFRYIAYNPCNAGLVGSPEQWRWSAHRALLGLSRPSGGLDCEAAWWYVGGQGGYRSLTATPPPTLAELCVHGRLLRCSEPSNSAIPKWKSPPSWA